MSEKKPDLTRTPSRSDAQAADIARRKLQLQAELSELSALSPSNFSRIGSNDMMESMESLELSHIEYKIPSVPDLVELDDAIHGECVITQLTQAYDSPVPLSWDVAKGASLGASMAANTAALQCTESHRNKEMFCNYALDTFKSMDQLLVNNRKWAELIPYFNASAKRALDWMVDHLFTALNHSSDSRVPANQIIGLAPGEVFVHRNVANIVTHTDLNCLSVVQFAVDILHVKHIIVCGHYGCGGVLASMTDRQYGLIDNWLRALKDVHKDNKKEVEALPDWKAKADLLCELNVARSVDNLVSSSILQGAWAREQDVTIHGWCYRLSDGIIKDLGIHHTNADEMDSVYKLAMNRE